MDHHKCLLLGTGQRVRANGTLLSQPQSIRSSRWILIGCSNSPTFEGCCVHPAMVLQQRGCNMIECARFCPQPWSWLMAAARHGTRTAPYWYLQPMNTVMLLSTLTPCSLKVALSGGRYCSFWRRDYGLLHTVRCVAGCAVKMIIWGSNFETHRTLCGAAGTSSNASSSLILASCCQQFVMVCSTSSLGRVCSGELKSFTAARCRIM